MKEYIVPVVKLLAMLLRLSNQNSSPYNLSADSVQCLKKLSTAAADKDTNPTPPDLLNLHTILLNLWTTAWIKNTPSDFPDPTINALALDMLEPDRSFKHPRRTTGPIAKFEYCMRMTFMKEIHNQGKDTGHAGYTKAANDLAVWYTEKHESTFNSLRSLQHRATSIAESELGLPRIWWTDRKQYRSMLYLGRPVEFSNIQKMFVHMEMELITMWETNILCGLSLHIPYHELFDDLTNTAVGYSFLSDPANPFHQNRDKLLLGILESPLLRERFITDFDADGSPNWNLMALQQWLFKYSQFEGLLLARANMLGGAPGRMTELTAMTYKNIATSPTRNFVALGKYVAMLVTYSKTTAMSGSHKMILHAFDAVTSDLIVQNLSIARPFAELAATLLYSDDALKRQLYRDHLFVNHGRLFTTTDVSNIISRYSLPNIGIQITVGSWRHICLAFKRKLASSLEDIADEEEADTVEAQQATHSRRTENRLYALSADSLSGVPEDLLPLFLDASVDWQIISKVGARLRGTILDSRAIPGK